MLDLNLREKNGSIINHILFSIYFGCRSVVYNIYICCEEETSDMIESFTPDSDFMILLMSCLNVGLVTRSIVL